ncbi:MAG: zinc-dependent alcohol dehydrogenase, partial [Candidatus Humimicrobiaceae bacterium]
NSMRALQKYDRGKGFVEVRDVEKPVIKRDGDVLIKVKAAGICGTDLHIFDDEFTYYPPVTLGHEFVGVVEETGKNVCNVKTGDRVVSEPHAEACMVCDLCRRGYWQLCSEKRSPGWGQNGAFTDYLTMPAKLLHKIPDNLSDDVAALIEPLAIAVNYVCERARVIAQETVVVVGAGPLGILCAFAAKENGAGKVIVLGVDADEAVRFPAALELGADRTVNVLKEDAQAVISDLTDCKMADLVIEASGSENGIQTAINSARVLGRLCAVGITGKLLVSVNWDVAQKKALDMYFNFSSNYTSWDRAIAIASNTKRDLAKLVTKKESIENWEKAFADLKSGLGIKTLFIPDCERK